MDKQRAYWNAALLLCAAAAVLWIGGAVDTLHSTPAMEGRAAFVLVNNALGLLAVAVFCGGALVLARTAPIGLWVWLLAVSIQAALYLMHAPNLAYTLSGAAGGVLAAMCAAALYRIR